MVTAVIDARGESVRVTGIMRGRAVRAGGKPVAVEIDVVDSATLAPTGRTTLAPFKHVDALNDAARMLLTDPGPVRA